MIEFGEGPTNEQVHELFQETTVLLTMLTHPGVHDSDQARRQAEQTYTLSPPYALVVLASIGAGRFWRLPGHRHAGDATSAAPFPRDILQTVPADGRPDLLFLAIDLVEAVASGGRARPLVDQLLVDGVQAYRVLLWVVHELGWLAAQADETIKSVVELVTVEALTAEQDWLASRNDTWPGPTLLPGCCPAAPTGRHDGRETGRRCETLGCDVAVGGVGPC